MVLEKKWLEIVDNLKEYEFDLHIIGGGEPNKKLLESFKSLGSYTEDM